MQCRTWVCCLVEVEITHHMLGHHSVASIVHRDESLQSLLPWVGSGNAKVLSIAHVHSCVQGHFPLSFILHYCVVGFCKVSSLAKAKRDKTIVDYQICTET